MRRSFKSATDAELVKACQDAHDKIQHPAGHWTAADLAVLDELKLLRQELDRRQAIRRLGRYAV